MRGTEYYVLRTYIRTSSARGKHDLLVTLQYVTYSYEHCTAPYPLSKRTYGEVRTPVRKYSVQYSPSIVRLLESRGNVVYSLLATPALLSSSDRDEYHDDERPLASPSMRRVAPKLPVAAGVVDRHRRRGRAGFSAHGRSIGRDEGRSDGHRPLPPPPPPHPPSSPWAPSSGPPGPPSGDAVSLHTTAQTPPYTRKALLNTLCLFRQHFEVTSESQLVAAQEQVRGEIEPEVARLLDRVDGHLDRLARREDALIARTELLQGRVGDGAAAAAKAGSSALGKAWGKGKGKGNATVPTASAETPRDHRIEERLRALRQKKERLAFAVERLSLQAGQRERQLRKSMAG